MNVEAARQAVMELPVDVAMLASLRSLGPRERRLLTLFERQGTATTSEIAAHLGLSDRTLVVLYRTWLRENLLILHDPSRKNRAYRLHPDYETWVTGRV